MLKTKDLIEGIDEKFVPMLKEVNIPDFTKCIATLTWKNIDEVNDNMIKEYLLLWAKSKYKFYQMLGNKIRVDSPLTYKRLKEEISNRMKDLAKEFPSYCPWLSACYGLSSNKMTAREVNWEFIKWTEEVFPQTHWEGCSLTRFFKTCLMAPDELVNKIAQVFENNTIKATYTISIDPVDMMLASENPYDWSSCYKLSPDEEESHADGCLAAVIDSSTLITYVWNKEGDFLLKHNNLKFKSVRYKKMRAWISIAPDFNAFYMNDVYPGRRNYEEDFKKALRLIIEKTISDYTQTENKWIKGTESLCQRRFPYGYNEYDNQCSTFIREGYEEQEREWFVYDQRIICPCGCGLEMPGFFDCGSSECDHAEYNGEGYGCQGLKEVCYCEYCGDYCDRFDSDDCCYECYYWKNAHPVCSLDGVSDCQGEDCHIEDGFALACEKYCCDCYIWEKLHKRSEKEE